MSATTGSFEIIASDSGGYRLVLPGGERIRVFLEDGIERRVIVWLPGVGIRFLRPGSGWTFRDVQALRGRRRT